MEYKICLICEKVFYKGYRSRKSWSFAKYCSRKCYWKTLIGQDRGGRLKLKCKWCGKNYYQWKHVIKGRGSKFCSHQCFAKSLKGIKFRRKKPIEIICQNCKKKFEVYLSLKNRKFCSLKCCYSFYRKYPEKHPRWKGGITSEYNKFKKSLEYKQWRKAVFERDNYHCQICGFRNKIGEHRDLHPHHLVSASKYPEFRLCIDNGLTVCYKCHGSIHSINFKNRKYRKKKKVI